MKRMRQILKVTLAKVFFVANYVICLMIFDWKEFFEYLEKPARISCYLKPYGGGKSIDFSVFGAPISIFDVVINLFEGAFYLLSFPSTIITEMTLAMFKTSFPFWCYETFDLLYIPIFAVINSFYWVCLAYMIELGYSKYRQLYPPKNNYLSIFPK